MRQAKIYYKKDLSGTLTQHDDGSFTFRYLDNWFADSGKKPISLTLPKSQQEYNSKYLFPFFYNLLPEGTNKQIVCKTAKIDPDDYFGLLMTTAHYDTIGAITVQKIEEK